MGVTMNSSGPGSVMKAVVMAGGEGSRLRPLTSQHPKPLVPVAGTPVIEHILRLLRVHGITKVILTLQYLGAEIRNRLGDGSDLDMEIEYVVEDRPLGTAGSVRNAAHLLDDTFLVISGDALTDIDLTAVIEEHRRRGSDASIVLKSVPNPLEYGVVVTEPDGRVSRFLEKPSWGEVFSDHANTGIYVIEPSVLEHIKPGTSVDWSQDVFPRMLRRREPLFGIVAEGYWCDIGSIQSYMQANWDLLPCALDRLCLPSVANRFGPNRGGGSAAARCGGFSMGSLSIWHWIVVIAVVLLLFGRGKISELMGDVAQGIKAFKKGMSDDETAKADPEDHHRRRKPADPLKQHAQTERKFEA